MKIDAFIKNVKPDIRTLEQMSDVVYDQKWFENADKQTPLYYMYRGLGKNEADKKKIADAGLRYDITIIPAKMMGKEFIKTAGHAHSKHFPEIYEVLEGNAVYLMQKFTTKKIKDVYIVKAKKGDKVIIPPDYAHITINASKKDLKMANWIAIENKSSYELIQNKDGGCYFATKGFFGIKWIKNGSCIDLPELREQQPTNFTELNLDKNIPMYTLVKALDKLDFLKNPTKYPELWAKILE